MIKSHLLLWKCFYEHYMKECVSIIRIYKKIYSQQVHWYYKIYELWGKPPLLWYLVVIACPGFYWYCVYQMLLLLLFAWPPVHEVCPNYEVAMFQPWTGTSLDLVSIDNCYVAMILRTTPLFLSAARCPPGGGATLSCPFYLSIANHLFPTQDHPPTRASPVSIPEYWYTLLPYSDSTTFSHPPLFPHLQDSRHSSLTRQMYKANSLDMRRK